MNHALLVGIIVKSPPDLRTVFLRSQVQFDSLCWINILLLLLDHRLFGLVGFLKRTLSPGLGHYSRTLPRSLPCIAYLRFSAIGRLWGSFRWRVSFLESL